MDGGLKGKKKAADNCACGRKREDGSCFTINELRTIAAAIKRARGGVAIPGRTKRELYEGVLDAMSCDGDRCLSEKPDLPPHLQARLREALVPMAPREWLSNPTAWLSNFDIEAKVREIVRNKRQYLFLGVFPMDAEHKERGSDTRCVSQALCDYHPVAARQKHSRFAAVFNTDYHGLPGSHWVALMGFVKRRDPRYGLYYYDSTGRRPTGDINQLITRLSGELKEADGDEPPYLYNDTQHQSSNTECGMFCISFIDAMVNTRRTFPEMCERMQGDAEMVRRRSVYFELPVKGGKNARKKQRR